MKQLELLVLYEQLDHKIFKINIIIIINFE